MSTADLAIVLEDKSLVKEAGRDARALAAEAKSEAAQIIISLNKRVNDAEARAASRALKAPEPEPVQIGNAPGRMRRASTSDALAGGTAAGRAVSAAFQVGGDGEIYTCLNHAPRAESPNDANDFITTQNVITASAGAGSLHPVVRPCSCPKCAALCRRNPGWMTPAEAMKAISAGHRDRLMRDWLEPGNEVGNDERIYVLAAASIGCEGSDAPSFEWMDMLMGNCSKGRCTFLKDGLCEIHATDYKPKQCRESMGCVQGCGPDNYEMARLWNTDEGREALACWSNAALCDPARQPKP